MALALTYLGGIASIGGALIAGLLAQAGIFTLLANGGADGQAGTYVFAMSGLALIVMAIFAPDGITGAFRQGLQRLRRALLQSRSRRRALAADSAVSSVAAHHD